MTRTSPLCLLALVMCLANGCGNSKREPVGPAPIKVLSGVGHQHLSYTPKGTQLVATEKDGAIKLWDSNSGIRTLAPQFSVSSYCFSSDGLLLATGAFDQKINVWDVSKAELRQTLQHHRSYITALAISPDSRHLASGENSDLGVALWDLKTGQLKLELRPPNDALPSWCRGVDCVAFSPDGNTLTVAIGPKLVMWDLATGKPRSIITVRKGNAMNLSYAPDGKTLAVATWVDTTELWDTMELKLRHVLDSKHVYSIGFSPDSSLLVTGGGCSRPTKPPGGAFSVWDVSSGKKLGMVERPYEGVILSLAFSPDGKNIAVTGADGIAIWDVNAVITQEQAK